MNIVKIENSTLIIQTYPWKGEDDEAPLTREFTPRGQPIYPYFPQENVCSIKEDRKYKTVVFENEFLRLVFLPEMNGRLYSSYDKVNRREMFYNNPQMKPSLFGLRGAWCANGVEYNFPNSHSTTSLEEISCKVLKHEDGSASFICGNCEHVGRMLWSVETILRPGSANIEMLTRLYNCTEYPKRFYYWLNAAVPLYPETQFIYPESTRRLYTHPPMDISRIAYLNYPIHDGQDISRFKNIHQHFPVFAEEMKDDFFGVFHHHLKSGIIHIADHALVRGRKIWMFGNARDGKIWIDQLTDSGVDYCELQTGPFSLQSDYRLLAPGGMHVQKDVWMPVGDIGGFNAASEKLAAKITREKNRIAVALSAASPVGMLTVAVIADGRICCEKKLSPEVLKIENMEFKCPPCSIFAVDIRDENGVTVLSYAPQSPVKTEKDALEMPKHRNKHLEGNYWEQQGWPAKAYKLYSEDDSVNSKLSAARMDMDSGLFLTALDSLEDQLLLDRNNAEALLYAGICMKKLGRFHDSEKLLSRCCDNAKFIPDAIHQLAEVSVMQGKYDEALARLEHLHAHYWIFPYPAAIRVLCLRKKGRREEALEAMAEAETLIPFEPLLSGERFFLESARSMDGFAPQNLLETVTRYINLNRFSDALEIIEPFLRQNQKPPALVWYYKAFIEGILDDHASAAASLAQAGKAEWSRTFIFRSETEQVMKYAIEKNPSDHRSLYHLGNFYAHKRRWDEALDCWRKVEGEFKSLSLRGEGVYWWKIAKNPHMSVDSYRKVVSLGNCGNKTLWEYDCLLEGEGLLPQRLELLALHENKVNGDKRLLLRKADVMLAMHRPDEALDILVNNKFTLCEGKILPRLLYEEACWQKGEKHRREGLLEKALECFVMPMSYPENLGVGKPAANMEAEWYWRCGHLCLEMGDKSRALEFFKKGMEPGGGIRIDFFPLKKLIWEHDPEIVELPVWLNKLFTALCFREMGMDSEYENACHAVREYVAGKIAESRLQEPDVAVLKFFIDILDGRKAQEVSVLKNKIPHSRITSLTFNLFAPVKNKHKQS